MKMTTRNHSVTFFVGFAFICIVTLLFLLNKTHESLQETKVVLGQLNGKYSSLSKQFDSLYEYKDRLEKAIIHMKEEKANIITGDEDLRSELALLKTSDDKLIHNLQEELDACHRREEIRFVNNVPPVEKPAKELHSTNSAHNIQSLPVPLQLEPIVAELNVPSPSTKLQSQSKPSLVKKKELKEPKEGSSIKKITSLKTLHSSDVHVHTSKEKDKEAVQSPIAHVPNLPAQPSGDPNEDPAGNIFV